jgi:hypothetical protein
VCVSVLRPFAFWRKLLGYFVTTICSNSHRRFKRFRSRLDAIWVVQSKSGNICNSRKAA